MVPCTYCNALRIISEDTKSEHTHYVERYSRFVYKIIMGFYYFRHFSTGIYVPCLSLNIAKISRTSNLRKLRTVLFVNEWILSYFCVILSGDCVYSCSLLRRFTEICVFTNKIPYILRNTFVAVYKQTEQSPHSERITS